MRRDHEWAIEKIHQRLQCYPKKCELLLHLFDGTPSVPRYVVKNLLVQSQILVPVRIALRSWAVSLFEILMKFPRLLAKVFRVVVWLLAHNPLVMHVRW